MNQGLDFLGRLIRPVLITCTLLLLTNCSKDPNEKRAEQLLNEANQEYLDASQSTRSSQCDVRQTALNKLLQVEKLTQEASLLTDDPMFLAQARRLRNQADDQFHALIRVSYGSDCCWAVNLVIQCAEEHIQELPEPQLAELEQVKIRYKRDCYPSQSTQPYQMAMLLEQ